MAPSSALRRELQDLLRSQAILYSTSSAPITHRTGEISAWAFYSWNISLTAAGLRLAAQNILEALGTFGSTQLASYGYTGLPLLSACILEGGGNYTGLSIREKRKAHLTNRRIDGVIDRSQPVVIIDDSLSSGTSLYKAIKALEEEGLEVEGTIALVHFPYRGAKEWANAAGYRTVTLFDIWTDLGMADPTALDYTGPDRLRDEISSEQMPEDLPPAVLARRVAEFYLRTRTIPRWPARLDDSYDARGGTFVSFRRRTDEERVARDGFWHFDPANSDPARDVVFATIDTLTGENHGLSLASLAELKIAVTFFGSLEEVSPAKLDFDRYGIVVRSKVWPEKLGGALPNTQVFISEIEQYRHARKTNAKVAEKEPHCLFRHPIRKYLEPDVTWLPYGCAEDDTSSWWRDERIGSLLTAKARAVIADLCGNASAGIPLPDSVIPVPIEGVAVTLYANGLCGYGLSYEPVLDRAVIAAAAAAWRDPRNRAKRSNNGEGIALVVSVLHNGESIAGGTRYLIERKIRRGLDAVTLLQEGKRYTLLPSALVYNGWSRQQFLDVIEELAGGRRALHSWRTHQVAAWVSEEHGTFPLRFGFPARESAPCSEEQCAATIDLLAGYIHRALDDKGIPAYRLCPADDEYVRMGTAARVLHGLYSLGIAGKLRGRADWKEAAAKGVTCCLNYVRHGSLDLPNHEGGLLADAVLLGAASACGLARFPTCAEAARRVAALVHDSGWIGAGAKRLEIPQDQEFLPGAAVWALASYCRATKTPLPGALRAARRFYEHRFREYPTWGSPWLAQGWAAVFDLTNDAEDAEMPYLAADWVAERQLEKNGAFLEDLSPDEPSFNSGFVAEGVAGAWRVALVLKDDERAQRYEHCWRKAIGHVRTLLLEGGDVFPFRAPGKAVGGIRCTASRGDIRIDQVSHALHALVEGYRNLDAARGAISPGPLA
jgi:orotate phosphoribosyltransferase/AMMECR1 domain-containing protein